MVRHDPPLAGGQPVLPLHPVQDLAGGFLREGEQENALSRDSLLPKPAIPLDKNPGLARTRPGDDQQWAPGVSHRNPLLLVENARVRDHGRGRAWR